MSKNLNWVYIPLFLIVGFAIIPFLWMALSSFKTLAELYRIPVTILPDQPTFENYHKILYESNVPRYFLNSTIVSLGSTALGLVFAIPAAYAFARMRFRGSAFWQVCVLVAHLLPSATLIVPLYIMLGYFGLLNTLLGLTLVYTVLTLPLSIWMLTSYFRHIPVELEEAAFIDGASRWGILFRIMLPLSLPGIVVIVLYAFVATWNEFIFALTFANDTSVKTLPIGLAEFSTEYNTDWGAIMAASVIMTLPIAAIFLLLQRVFVGGLMSGAMKG
ncbi:ABC-type glycerol-3-phosphate transport system permease component [Rhizobium sp. BK313]|jgi:ABC-type glycerol-3-phosphate transport system permease component|uniref:carbohydrate ABC transporter permease n=1 Tax=Rhizobium sp. BK313 TaxID=2587081 RepID=UPI00105F1E0F|nr:carbohydrate ABC transporter permease [Rhizobium sp. BK313]MBB3458195.1 ABC-type glycerol-3-phosphate transport system permease component [Rhizobium sp. BK313]